MYEAFIRPDLTITNTSAIHAPVMHNRVGPAKPNRLLPSTTVSDGGRGPLRVPVKTQM